MILSKESEKPTDTGQDIAIDTLGRYVKQQDQRKLSPSPVPYAVDNTLDKRPKLAPVLNLLAVLKNQAATLAGGHGRGRSERSKFSVRFLNPSAAQTPSGSLCN